MASYIKVIAVLIKGPVLAIMLCDPLLLFWFLQERGVHCY